jgi:hypothetical protein
VACDGVQPGGPARTPFKRPGKAFYARLGGAAAARNRQTATAKAHALEVRDGLPPDGSFKRFFQPATYEGSGMVGKTAPAPL